MRCLCLPLQGACSVGEGTDAASPPPSAHVALPPATANITLRLQITLLIGMGLLTALLLSAASRGGRAHSGPGRSGLVTGVFLLRGEELTWPCTRAFQIHREPAVIAKERGEMAYASSNIECSDFFYRITLFRYPFIFSYQGQTRGIVIYKIKIW